MNEQCVMLRKTWAQNTQDKQCMYSWGKQGVHYKHGMKQCETGLRVKRALEVEPESLYYSTHLNHNITQHTCTIINWWIYFILMYMLVFVSTVIKAASNCWIIIIYFFFLSSMLIPVQTIVEQEGVGILSSRDEKGHTPAHWACLGGHTTILRFLIENKVHLSLFFHFVSLFSSRVVVYGYCHLTSN